MRSAVAFRETSFRCLIVWPSSRRALLHFVARIPACRLTDRRRGLDRHDELKRDPAGGRRVMSPRMQRVAVSSDGGGSSVPGPIYMPPIHNAFEFVFSGVFKYEARAGGQVLDSLGDHHF